MSNIVDKIIYNTLIKEGVVALSDLGTVRLTGEPREVVFEEAIDPEAPLLTEVIAQEGGISEQEADTLYRDWQASSRKEDGTIVIDGVGQIPPRRIVMDGVLNKALNHSHEALPTARLRKRRTDSWLWWILGIVIAACAALWAIMPWDVNSIRIGIWEEVEESAEEVGLEPSVEPFEEVVVDVAVEPAPQAEAKAEVEAPAVEPAKQQNTHPSPAATNKRYNLSVGVYSTKQNARDCVRRDPLKIGSANYVIGDYPGGKWVVMAHSTNNWNEAEKLRSKYKRQGKDVWIFQRY